MGKPGEKVWVRGSKRCLQIPEGCLPQSESESQSIRLFAAAWTVGSVELSRLEYWRG